MNTTLTRPTGTPAFGVLLQRYRHAAGLTQEALAERAGLSARGISDLERGVSRTHRPDTVQRLANALGLSARERAIWEQAALGAGHPALRLPAAPPALLPDPPVPFIGRGRERTLVDRLVSGQGAPVLLVAGEPGIGKSRLLQEAVTHAVGRGWTVLEGGCQRRAGQGLYAPLMGALQRHLQSQSPLTLRAALRGCAWLVRLLPELADGPIEPLPAWTLPPAQERRLMVEAVIHYLANVAGPAGTLLVLDDLQWADPDALDVVSALVRSGSAMGTVPLRVIGAYRDTEVQTTDPLAALVDDLARTAMLVHHRLTALSAAQAADLLAALLPSPAAADHGLRAQLLERTGGVPFFLISSVRGLRSGGEPQEIPWDLAQTVRQRIELLPPAARSVLGVAAVAGRQVGGALLLTVATQPEEDVLAALEAACRAHVLEDAGADGYRFAHDVIREVVEADLGSARRSVLHRRIAEALEVEQGTHPADLLAYHYARGDVPDKAVHYLEQAGDQARVQYAHAAAERHYRALAELLERLGRRREVAAAREKLGAVLAATAQYDAALEAYGQAAEAFRAAGDLECLARVSAALGDVYSRQTKAHDGLRLLAPLLAQVEMQGHAQGLAVLSATMARLYYGEGRWEEAVAVGKRSSTLARSVGDDRLWATATLWRGTALHKLGRVEEALRVVEEVLPAAEAAGDLRTLCIALMHISCQYEDWGELERSRHYSDRATAVADRSGDPVLRTLMTARRGMTALYLGDWRQARALFEEAMALDRQVGLSEISAGFLHDLGRLELAEGDWAAATHCLEQSLAIAERSADPWGVREVQRSLAERDLLLGQAAAAQARVQPLLDQAGVGEWEVPPLLVRLAWAQLDLGELRAAETTVAQAITGAQAMTYRVALVDALRVQAQVFTRQRRWEEATQSLEDGLALARGMPYPYAEGRLLHVYGAMHRAKGAPEPARARLAAALAIFRRLGARKDMEHVEHALAALPIP